MATETQRYETISQFDDIEVREYPSCIVAETELKGTAETVGNQAFSVLAGYIFGKNGGGQKIAMTAPVTQSAHGGTTIAMTAPVTQTQGAGDVYRVRFVMPRGYTLKTLPVPLDDRVALKVMPAQRMAVLRYSGTWSQANYEDHLAKLRAQMQRHGLAAQGEPVWARFDPPWKPWFMRHNEIQVPVNQVALLPTLAL